MSVAASLLGTSYRTTIYDSVVGKIQLETEILVDGGFSITVWVIYPDGVGEEVHSVEEATEKLEI
jgi:hypothetical protein